MRLILLFITKVPIVKTKPQYQATKSLLHVNIALNKAIIRGVSHNDSSNQLFFLRAPKKIFNLLEKVCGVYDDYTNMLFWCFMLHFSFSNTNKGIEGVE